MWKSALSACTHVPWATKRTKRDCACSTAGTATRHVKNLLTIGRSSPRHTLVREQCCIVCTVHCIMGTAHNCVHCIASCILYCITCAAPFTPIRRPQTPPRIHGEECFMQKELKKIATPARVAVTCCALRARATRVNDTSARSELKEQQKSITGCLGRHVPKFFGWLL